MTSAAMCDMAGDWLMFPGSGVVSNKYYPAVDIPGHPGDFNISIDLRHGPQTVPGHVDSSNAVTVQMTDTDVLHGQFTPNCS